MRFAAARRSRSKTPGATKRRTFEAGERPEIALVWNQFVYIYIYILSNSPGLEPCSWMPGHSARPPRHCRHLAAIFPP